MSIEHRDSLHSKNVDSVRRENTGEVIPGGPDEQKGISSSVFNLLFKDLVESEKIKLYMDELQHSVYAEGVTQAEFSARMSELTDRYIVKGMSRKDKASIIRYISACAKIESHVKANLCAIQQTASGDTVTEDHELVCTYHASQDMVNEWGRVYADTHHLPKEWTATPDLAWGLWHEPKSE
ncbi:hypothetical protein DFP93_10150 [Aneurinibacillus soli]|uniref:Uncharacterized protein n=1 Tax=Aneurinibacillus soli TaxID=1500254 RepID=A0A0U5BCQ8_9BACL|nr:hypothetical protein [Aneurinibacillus soli]PYE64026.1 hypothetical protein DFP93_10150 [Aneurinibacillus soli]BAU27975.1 hypothetical protein CB4_02149 [Aneurinibacillus soli]